MNVLYKDQSNSIIAVERYLIISFSLRSIQLNKVLTYFRNKRSSVEETEKISNKHEQLKHVIPVPKERELCVCV